MLEADTAPQTDRSVVWWWLATSALCALVTWIFTYTNVGSGGVRVAGGKIEEGEGKDDEREVSPAAARTED